MKKKVLSLLTGLSIGAMNTAVFATGALDAIQDPNFGKDTQGSQIVTQVGSPIFGAIQAIGVIVAVIMVAYVGIKYLTAGAGTKAEVKSNLVPMLAGAALVALAPTLVGWAFGVFGA